MATFYRGAGIGTYWHANDAKLTGFFPHAPRASRSTATLIAHVKDGTTHSPYVSLTRSYSVAWTYAVFSGYEKPTAANPAYVYRVDIDDSRPAGILVLDPVCEIAKSVPRPLSPISYQHDGFADFLIGVVDPIRMAAHLATPIKQPPPGGGTSRPANLSAELETFVRALRDAELLAAGPIPPACVVNKFAVF